LKEASKVFEPTAAIIASALVMIAARIFHPFSVYLSTLASLIVLLPGLMMLVPGSIGFGRLAKFMEKDVVSGVTTAFSMILIAVALVTGLLIANVIAPPRKTL
jgi:uncharacterized membrane protein YjjB (DUF3815 family)